MRFKILASNFPCLKLFWIFAIASIEYTLGNHIRT